MADNKADKALKNAKYSVKLILGSDPKTGPKVIDITAPVMEAVAYEDVVTKNATPGIAYQIVGIRENADAGDFGFGQTVPLRTNLFDIFLIQDIERLLNAAVVNAKQLSALKELVREVFRKRELESQQGAETALAKGLLLPENFD